MIIKVGGVSSSVVVGGKYDILLGAVESSMRMSLLLKFSGEELSVMKRIEQLQISRGASVQMWLKSIVSPSAKEPAHSCSASERGKLDPKWLN